MIIMNVTIIIVSHNDDDNALSLSFLYITRCLSVLSIYLNAIDHLNNKFEFG